MGFQGCGPILQSKQCRSWVPSGVIKLILKLMMSNNFPICFLWCSCIFLWFSHDFPSKLALHGANAQPPGDLRRHGRPFFWPRWRRGHHGKARQKDGIGWTIVMFFNEKVASYSHNIPANETIVNGNILGIWQEYLLNDIQFFHTLMWILMNIIYAF